MKNGNSSATTLVTSARISTTLGARYIRLKRNARITLRSAKSASENRTMGRPAARMSLRGLSGVELGQPRLALGQHILHQKPEEAPAAPRAGGGSS
jgi:hypothetical protein